MAKDMCQKRKEAKQNNIEECGIKIICFCNRNQKGACDIEAPQKNN